MQGGTLELLQLEVLLGERPSSALEEALGLRERAASESASLALELLEALDDAGCLRTALADRVSEAARGRQRPDGSWHALDSLQVASSTSAAIGANHALFLTAMLGAFLGRTARSSATALHKAGSYLAAHWSPELVQGGSWHAICGYAHFFSNVPHEISDSVLQWCGRELERAFRTGRFDVVRAARIFTLCDAHALPGAKLDARELLPALLRARSVDGGWPAVATPMRVIDTFWAAQALVKLRARSWSRAAE
jgi:hypothetical protein